MRKHVILNTLSSTKCGGFNGDQSLREGANKAVERVSVAMQKEWIGIYKG